MREFFKYVFATVLGVVLSFFLIILVSILLIVGFVSSMESDKTVPVSDNSVLFMNLDQAIVERTPDDTFANLPIVGGSAEKSIGLDRKSVV